jgi:hypothetical protein
VTSSPSPTPSPSDNTTLSAVLESYAAAGFDGDFVLGEVDVSCRSCGAAAAPAAFELHSLRRLEGASDPADMAAVLALACPSCGRRGTLVARFGPESSAAEVDLLQQLRDHRFEDTTLPPSAAPHEDRTDWRGDQQPS